MELKAQEVVIIFFPDPRSQIPDPRSQISTQNRWKSFILITVKPVAPKLNQKCHRFLKNTDEVLSKKK